MTDIYAEALGDTHAVVAILDLASMATGDDPLRTTGILAVALGTVIGRSIKDESGLEKALELCRDTMKNAAHKALARKQRGQPL